jgi:molybdate transport system substrate-binding protein
MKAALLALFTLAMFVCDLASADNITVLSTVGVQGFLEQVRHVFELKSGDHLTIRYGTAAQLSRRLDAGESFDVVILTQSMIHDLASHRRVVPATSAAIARTGIGIAAKSGAARPFIGTRDALRNALSASSRIAYTKVGHSAAAAARLFNGLGISGSMKKRTYLDARPAGGVLAVAEGKAQLGIALLTEIAADPRVELVGPLPRYLQTYIVFAAAIAPDTKDPAACRAFIAFLRTPDEGRKLQNVGMEHE